MYVYSMYLILRLPLPTKISQFSVLYLTCTASSHVYGVKFVLATEFLTSRTLREV